MITWTGKHTEMRLLARFNAWKIAALSLFVIALGITPNLANFGDGLTYTTFYFTTPVGIAVRIIASVILGLIGVLTLARSVEAFIHPDAVWIDAECLYWRAFGIKSLALSNIDSVSAGRNNSVRIELKNGERAKELVTWVYKKDDAPEPLISDLRAAITFR